MLAGVIFTIEVTTRQIAEFLQPSEKVAMLPICGPKLCLPSFCLSDSLTYVAWESRFRKVLWGKEMLDILENVAQPNRRQACGFIGNMEDVIEVLRIQKPMEF